MILRTIALLGLACGLALPLAAQTLERVRSANLLTLGYIDQLQPFSSGPATQPSGYVIELCQRIAERIRREQAQVTAARTRDDDRVDFAKPFAWPVKGRISGRFGNQRVYNGKPGSPHSGMDIAAPAGTPVLAPAAGVVTFAAPDLYLTGGTLLLDHGFGISSNFLHLSRIDVKVGDRVEQGQMVGAVGATGRATGPHLHWGMNWFDVRIDPLLVLERTQ